VAVVGQGEPREAVTVTDHRPCRRVTAYFDSVAPEITDHAEDRGVLILGESGDMTDAVFMPPLQVPDEVDGELISRAVPVEFVVFIITDQDEVVRVVALLGGEVLFKTTWRTGGGLLPDDVCKFAEGQLAR
jgi:hypothetical protein